MARIGIRTASSGGSAGGTTGTMALSNNSANQLVIAFAKGSYGTIFLKYQVKETGVLKFKSGYFTVQSDGSSAVEYVDAITTLISDPGVTFSADISGANIRILATTTNTGNARTGNFIVRTLGKL